MFTQHIASPAQAVSYYRIFFTPLICFLKIFSSVFFTRTDSYPSLKPIFPRSKNLPFKIFIFYIIILYYLKILGPTHHVFNQIVYDHCLLSSSLQQFSIEFRSWFQSVNILYLGDTYFCIFWLSTRTSLANSFPPFSVFLPESFESPVQEPIFF